MLQDHQEMMVLGYLEELVIEENQDAQVKCMVKKFKFCFDYFVLQGYKERMVHQVLKDHLVIVNIAIMLMGYRFLRITTLGN